MKRFILPGLVLLFSCSTSTIYNLDIDLLSFISDDKLEQELIFPASTNLEIFLFPEVEISSTGPGPKSQQGIVISFPKQEIEDINELSMKLEIETVVTNNSDSEQITGDRISLFLAPSDTENIYTEGVNVDLVNIETILPSDSYTLVQTFNLEENGSILEILREGEFRMGLAIYLTASAEFVPASLSLNRIHLSTKFTPADLLILKKL